MAKDRQSIRRVLWRWGDVTVFCANQHKELSMYRDLIASAEGVGAVKLDGLPHGSTPGRPTERAAECVMRLREMYAERIEWAVAAIDDELRFEAAVNDAISACLTPSEKAIIDLRYKRKMPFIHIGRYLKYAESTVKAKEQRAVDKLAKRIAVGQSKSGD